MLFKVLKDLRLLEIPLICDLVASKLAFCQTDAGFAVFSAWWSLFLTSLYLSVCDFVAFCLFATLVDDYYNYWELPTSYFFWFQKHPYLNELDCY